MPPNQKQEDHEQDVVDDKLMEETVQEETIMLDVEAQGIRKMRMDEFKAEAKKQELVIFEDKIYDIGEYAPKHPGGSKILSSQVGQDITEDFYLTGHSKNASMILREQLKHVADLEGSSSVTKKRKAPSLYTVPLQLTKKTILNNNDKCVELTFQWDPNAKENKLQKVPIALTPCGHVKLTVEDSSGSNSCTRSYTPVSFNKDHGTMTLAIKLYEDGEMSKLLRNAMNDKQNAYTFEIKGPFGDIEYASSETCRIGVKGRSGYSCSDHLILIAGGTGITPYLSVLRENQDQLDMVSNKITVIYCAASKDEIMYEAELQSLLSKRGNNCDELHVLAPSSRDTLCADISKIVGQAATNNNCSIVICGPPGMEDAVCNCLQNDLGHNQILTSTTTAMSTAAASVDYDDIDPVKGSTESSIIQRWMKQNGTMHVILFCIALLLPLISIAMNRGVPKSWPHNEAFPPYRKGFGGTFEIAGFNETDADGEKVTRYAYRLAKPTKLQWASPWIGYAIHQTLTLVVLYRAFKQQPKYSTEFRDFNYHMLYVQVFGVLLKYIQQFFFYNGLSEVLPLGFGTGTVFLFLIVVMIMYIPVRGLFFGYGKWEWMRDCANFFKLYHGFFIGVFIVNDFWYHPFESTVGHLAGILNDAMLLAQMVLIYTPFHLNKYWCLAMETFVIFHAALIALNRGSPGAVGAFGFAYFFIFVLTQMHGMGWSKLIRWFLGLLFVTTILIVYGLKLQGEEYGFKAMVLEVFFRIPILEYFTIFFICGYYILCKKIIYRWCCCKCGTIGQKMAIAILITIGTAICFMPLIAIFL